MPGKSAPDTLPAGLGRSGRVKGPCPRPYGAAGRTNPLTRPSLKTRQRPAQGLEGHCRSGMGVKARAATAQRLGLDAQERPQRSGLVAGDALPPAACHVANAPGGPPEALLPLIFASEVWGFGGGTPPEPGHKGTDQAKRREGPLCILALDLSTTNEVCVSAPLLRFGIGTEAPCRRLAWIYSVNMSSVSGSRSGASCGACWPPSITPLIPAFAIRFLRSWSSAITWFRALPFQPNSGLSL